MGFYFSQKDQVFNPSFLTWLQPVDRARSTDVHRRARQFWQVAGRPIRSTVQRALLSEKAPVDRAVDRTETCSLYPGLGRPTGRPTPTASFWSSIKGAFWGLKPVSSTLFRGFSPQIWEQIFPIKRRVLSRVFKVILWVFLHHFLPCFSHTNTWASIDYSFYRLSLIHIWRCRRSTLCRSRWSPYH